MRCESSVTPWEETICNDASCPVPFCMEMTLAASPVCSMVFHQQTEKHRGKRQREKLKGDKGLLCKAPCGAVASSHM